MTSVWPMERVRTDPKTAQQNHVIMVVARLGGPD
jgi:hypothetical protein